MIDQPLILTPHGSLVLLDAAAMPGLPAATRDRLRAAFRRGSGHALLLLGTSEVGTALPPVFAWWRDLAARFVQALCGLPEAGEASTAGRPLPGRVPLPDDGELQALAWSVPPMPGSEYLTPETVANHWADLETALQRELAESGLSLAEFLKARHPAWNLVGRVYLHLAEHRRDEQTPFAFLATYSTRLSAQGRAQHLPLGQALQEFSGTTDKDRLLALLLPLQRAGEQVPWLRDLIASREIYHPLRWTASEALRFLHDVPHLEHAGVIVRMPATWRANRPPRAQVSVTVGAQAPSLVGQDALLDFSLGVALEGESLTRDEINALLASTQGLVLIRGKWVEIDRERLRQTLDHFHQVEQVAVQQGLGFHAAMRLLAGAGGDGAAATEGAADWSRVVAGPWLAETLHGLRGPEGLAAVDPGEALHATLRPYQQVGVRWLHLLSRLRLGACLADDMGLGKTIQVIALVLVRLQQEGRAPSLLVAPASLLANWASEAARFAPTLRVLVAHPSALAGEAVKSLNPGTLAGYDLVITSYGALHRMPWVGQTAWRLAILDEAQAIKNPGTRQTRAAKSLKAQSRIALTGTPVENRLGDLWSIFDFTNPGLLGSPKQFTGLTRRLENAPGGYGPLRALIQPYLLRRLKTDKSVISDLPDKTELTAWCGLSKSQAALYQQGVRDLKKALESADGIARKGLVLATLMRFKQVCNHPAHWLGTGDWEESASGKLERLRELAEVIAAKQEKVLVFSQFSEATGHLAAFLGSVFGRSGLVLTGETPVTERQELVRRFQEDETVPFFVLSLKAGGSGLNLTAAAHVVHFDRWWNPAVENQATDRAFRIGQTRNVLVHKFVCRGTVEEKIDAMIAAKRELAGAMLDGGGELNLTELSDDELLRLVQLDLTTATATSGDA